MANRQKTAHDRPQGPSSVPSAARTRLQGYCVLCEHGGARGIRPQGVRRVRERRPPRSRTPRTSHSTVASASISTRPRATSPSRNLSSRLTPSLIATRGRLRSRPASAASPSRTPRSPSCSEEEEGGHEVGRRRRREDGLRRRGVVRTGGASDGRRRRRRCTVRRARLGCRTGARYDVEEGICYSMRSWHDVATPLQMSAGTGGAFPGRAARD